MNFLVVETLFLCERLFLLALPTILELESNPNDATRQRKHKRNCDPDAPPKYLILDNILERLAFLERITQESNRECFKNLRMSQQAFFELCRLFRDECELKDDQYVSIVEKMAIFLRTVAHHQKNRVLQSDFQRSGQTIIQSFHQVLCAVLKLCGRLLVQPVPIDDTCVERHWKFFQGCVGVLDGIYVPIHIHTEDQPRYLTRKGHLTTNVLGVYDTRGRFIYMLAGWEGSTADSRVLRDALTRPRDLRVQSGTYFLCDGGYMNVEGFLTPYRQTRYHIQEWNSGNKRPKTEKELFNVRHSVARNVIERAFGIWKKRFAVLRSPTFFPISTQCDIILACALIHNFVINVNPYDPLLERRQSEEVDGEDQLVSPTSSAWWNQFRDNLTSDMWAAYAAASRYRVINDS